jgi:Domain of unknown function (DUF4158)
VREAVHRAAHHAVRASRRDQGRYGLREFAEAEAEFAQWVRSRAWNTGQGPKTIFTDGVQWLRANAVLLPGVTTLARVVARVREEAADDLYATLAGLLSAHQRAALEHLVVVPDGARYSDLERWRRGPAKPSGRNLEKALNRAAEIVGVGVGALNLDANVPHGRVVDLARYEMTARAQALRRHGTERRLATLLATVAYLEARSIDDCLELLDLLMTTELLGKAGAATGKERARRHPGLVRHSARLAAAVEVLLEVTELGEERIATVTPFLKILTEVIEFGCTPEAGAALAAMRSLPRLLDRRTKATAADIDHTLLSGSWKSLVLPKTGGIDRNAYVFCVLTAFHRHLRRREIYAVASSRWRDPRAQLLAGEEWQRKKGPALTDLQLREDPDALLAEQARALDAALRDVAAQISARVIDTQVDDQGRLHVPKLAAIPEPPSLVDLRKRVAAMLPRVDLPEVILEVMAWVPAFTAAFTAVSGGRTRLEDASALCSPGPRPCSPT